MITKLNPHLFAAIVLAVAIIGQSVATVAATGDVRCLVVKCVVIKK